MDRPRHSFLYHLGEAFIFISFLGLVFVAASWVVDVTLYPPPIDGEVLPYCVNSSFCIPFLGDKLRVQIAISMVLVAVIGMLIRWVGLLAAQLDDEWFE